ncbi:MAG: UTP--glucose-1-phosphate uridylyltransferase GalU [Firmicutes bacterium]|nr:UTP--glucose-1-phosphate uridylyltransferase GalU [Bacillota bacterium]
MQVKKAVIPAAGMGTRFLPATKVQPKEMLPIVDVPTIQYVVEEAVRAGITEILIITGRSKRAIEDHFDKSVELEALLEQKGKNKELAEMQRISNLADIFYVRQKEALGLGHAVACARNFVGREPFAVLLGDDIVHAEIPVIGQLIDIYNKKSATVLGCQRVGFDNIQKYGAVDAEDFSEPVVQVRSLTEKPNPAEAKSDLAVLGRYVIDPEIFDILNVTPPGAGGEIQLTDALNLLARQQSVWAYSFEGRRYDVGDRLGYIEATIEYALRREDLAPQLKTFLKSLTF